MEPVRGWGSVQPIRTRTYMTYSDGEFNHTFENMLEFS